MKIAKHILIYTVFICIIAQGAALWHFCIDRSHADLSVEWASNCLSQQNVSHGSDHSPECELSHTDNECINILSGSIVTRSSGTNTYDDQDTITKPTILKPTSIDHPFSSFDFSKLKPNFSPIFADMNSLSIESTILIV
jgi:hypothetical protein